jgi:oligoendopeptidase F
MAMPATSAPSAPGVKTTPTRAEIPIADTWDLTPLFPSVAAWEQAFEDYKQAYPGITQFRGTLGQSPEQLLACLEFDKKLDLMLERLYHFASLQTAEDASNSDYLAREAKLQNLMTKAAEAGSFFTPELQALDDATFARFLQAPCLTPWVTRLQRIRRYKPHTLTANEERIMALAGPVLSGHDETFSQLTNVDMKFGVIRDEQDRELELSHGLFSSFLQKRDPELRRRAFHQYYAEFQDHKFTLASTLASSVKGDVFRARARNYPSALEAALFPDAIPVSVYDNLIASVRKNLPVLFRYFELRKRVLGLKEIHHYDTYVPMVGKIERKTTFDQAVDLVLDSLAPLGSEYTSVLGKGLRESRWCDRYETKGKRSGAFSSGSYGNPPYILMNYKEDVFSDVYTLAHEAGHSMHTWFSQTHQSYQDHHYPIFLAEVASTFNEELLTHHLLATTDNRDMRAYILNRQIDDIRGTVFRQTMFAEFEKIIHDMEEAGEALTLDSFRSAYRKLLVDYFGPGFALDDELELECLRIPHFYSAFYVYKYATGMSASIALSHRVLHGGPRELADYLGFLKSGGSRFPLETLQNAGVDMSSPRPVDDTLALFERRVAELEELLL